MDTADKVDQVQEAKKKTKKQDQATPLGNYIAEEAKKSREKKEANQIVEKYYELHGNKLLLCKKVASGTIHRTFIGAVTDKKDGGQVKEFVEKLKKENRLNVRI